ncbi:MAG: ATP-dependent Clp protease proteolytic subunit [Brevinematales bacterium]
MSYKTRKPLYKILEDIRGSKLIVYITGDRRGWETQIHEEVLDLLITHLDIINKHQKISLYLYSRGGNTLAAWGIVNLIRQFCKEFEVIVPSKARSAATLICLGSNNIVMTKQATLGPIDPSVSTPLNPQIPNPQAPGTTMPYPVNVEAIKGFIELAKEELKIKNSNELAALLTSLMEKVNPLVLGEVFRARAQIQMLARKLLKNHISDENKRKKIIEFLCSELGSHDYTINRKEAKEELHLPVEIPDDNLYKIIKEIYDDIFNDLQLNKAFDPITLLGSNISADYSITRALVESLDGGSDYFISDGRITKFQNPQGIAINDQRIFEGWKHE